VVLDLFEKATLLSKVTIEYFILLV